MWFNEVSVKLAVQALFNSIISTILLKIITVLIKNKPIKQEDVNAKCKNKNMN